MHGRSFCRPGAVATPDATSYPLTLPSATFPLLSSTALTALTQLQALGLSHNMLDSWPTAVERLAPSLRVVSARLQLSVRPPDVVATGAASKQLQLKRNGAASSPLLKLLVPPPVVATAPALGCLHPHSPDWLPSSRAAVP